MEQPSTKVSEGPSPDSWEIYRSTIKRLYLDEEKTLPELKQIMEHDFSFKASDKMYKRRFKLWKIDGKNLKRAEVKQIARCKVERDAVGKPSRFYKKGRAIDMADVQQYLRKHGFSSLAEFNRAASPKACASEIDCTTPADSPASPRVSSSMFENDETYVFQYGQSSSALSMIGRDLKSAERPSSLSDCLALSPATRSRRLLSLSPVPRTLALPEALSFPERILSTLSSYMKGGFELSIWEMNINGHLISKKASYSTFDDGWTNYQNIIITCFRQEKYVQLRQAMAKLCKDIELGTKFESPSLLPQLVYLIYEFYDQGLCRIVSILVSHAHNTAKMHLGASHPMAQICGMLCNANPARLELFSRLLQCQQDLLEEELGPWDWTTAAVRELFLYTVDPSEAVGRTRALLATLEAPESEYEWFQAMIILSEALINDRRYAEAEATCRNALEAVQKLENLHQRHAIRAMNFALLYILHVVADNNVIEAEHYIQQAVYEAAAAWGWRDSATIDYKLRHADLLRDLGRDEEAAEIEAQIQDILGPPEIEELLE